MKKHLLLFLSASIALAAIAAKPTMSQCATPRVGSFSDNILQKNNATETRVQSSNVIASFIGDKEVASKATTNDIAVKTMQKKNGALYKVLNKKSTSFNKISKSTPKIAIKATKASFYENFSGYDGTSYDWIPSGWQDISKVTPANVAPGAGSGKLNLTWCICPSKDLFDAIDGDNLARCQVSMNYGDDKETAQDEWLITPSMKVAENERLSFYFGYKPGWSLLDVNTMKFVSTPYSKGEAYISADDGATWEKVWDNLSDLATYTEDELMEDCYSYTPVWINVKIDMTKYYGKSVKVAFRYVGKGGESVEIDAVKLGIPSPEAYYTRPAGYFFNGLSQTFEGPSNNWLLGPASVTTTWENGSNDDSDTFKWTYTDPSDPYMMSDLTSTDVDLKAFYPEGMSYLPTLKASAPGANDSTYSWKGEFVLYGGSNILQNNSGNSVQMGCTNLDLNKGYTALTFGTDKYIFGSGSDAEWASLLDMKAAKITAIANYFEAPISPYVISKVWINAIVKAKPEAKFKLSIFSINENGSYDETLPIAIGTCNGSEVITTDGQSSIPFSLIPTGSEVPAELIISSAIIVKLEGFSDATTVTAFGPYNQKEINSNGECYSYFYLTTPDTNNDGIEKEIVSLFPTNIISLKNIGSLNTSFMFNLDAVYTYLEAKNNDVNFNADKLGGTKTFEVNSYANPKTWNITTDGDWISTAYRVNTTPYSDYNSYLDITAAALPENIEGRTGNVSVSIPAAELMFTVIQGTGGVNTIASNPIKIALNDGNFIINAPANVSSVEIFNVAGQLVAQSQLNGNSTIIEAQSLSAGLYIFKFNNGSIMKIAK